VSGLCADLTAGEPAPPHEVFVQIGSTYYYTEQRLFIGWAQVWRAKRREAYIRQPILIDPHSPPEFRVNIPVSNVDAFFDAFGVKPGDKMYRDPKDRVKIW
jgi:putative endopeptidase